MPVTESVRRIFITAYSRLLQTLAVKMWTGKDCKVPYETFNAARLSLSEGPGVNVAGRIGKTPRAVYNQETLKPGTRPG